MGEEGVVEVQDLEITRNADPELCLPLDEVKEYSIYDEKGNGYWFSDCYKSKKTIIIFIRHFLCFMTKEYVDDLALIPDKYFEETDTRLVVIGCGAFKFIQPFREATGYKGFLFTDPERKLYRKLGCRDRMTVGPVKESKHVKSNFFSGTFGSFWRGVKFHEFQGDTNQQGGAFIIGPGPVIHHIHRDIAPWQHAPINDLLALAGVQQVNFQKDKRVLTI